MLEVGLGVVSLAEIQSRVFQIRPVYTHGDSPITPITRRVVSDVSKKVIERCILVDLRECGREIVCIEKRLPACIARERDQRLLRGEIRIVLAQHAAARINGTSTAASATAA